MVANRLRIVWVRKIVIDAEIIEVWTSLLPQKSLCLKKGAHCIHSLRGHSLCRGTVHPSDRLEKPTYVVEDPLFSMRGKTFTKVIEFIYDREAFVLSTRINILRRRYIAPMSNEKRLAAVEETSQYFSVGGSVLGIDS